MTNQIVAMTKSEFSRLEGVIGRGKRAFIEVGNALRDIRDKRGYQHWRDGCTFEQYCREQWD